MHVCRVSAQVFPSLRLQLKCNLLVFCEVAIGELCLRPMFAQAFYF